MPKGAGYASGPGPRPATRQDGASWAVLRDQHQKVVKQKVREVYEKFARLLAKEHRERLD